ncbi:MAG: EamA/RhaT family transporter [Thermoprotei archaeon]|nr:MAG: EamA/RhaT family transporter [Thermoprotei archaeon]RLF24359.1 MAG: EamA/RhaT family transporter [Thermoprotei archaeon]
MRIKSSKKTTSLMALLGTTILWGSSFPVIKIVMNIVNEYRYTWTRASIALLGLLPYVAYYRQRGGIDMSTIKGGLIAGLAYSLGIWLQGWGTAYTTASNSAFITGLNVVFVHAYQGLIERRYGLRLATSLTLAMIGLYLLTSPSGGLNIGDVLVLLSAFAWAMQVIIVGMWSHGDPLVFTFFEFLPSMAFIIPDLVIYGEFTVAGTALISLAYLGLVCGDVAFALQVYGQRSVSPAVAALIFLLEPVVAALIACAVLHEYLTPIQSAGALLILMATALSSTQED